MTEERVPAGYAAVRALVRLLLSVFYGRVEMAGGDRFPAEGPLIVAANHHNSVVDAMLLLALSPRRLRTLANAPLFTHPVIGPFLRALGALPVHRRQEAGTDPSRNAALFEATTRTLHEGGAILIFPEGRTQPEPVLLELRTGAARMLLAAAADGGAPRPTLLPVGLVFHRPGTFRDGRALAVVGPPVPTADLAATAEEAARTLTDRLSVALRALMVEADDRRTLRLLEVVEDLWREEEGTAPSSAAAQADWRRRAMSTYRLLARRDPSAGADLRARVEAFADELDRAGLAAAQLSRTWDRGTAVGFAFREGTALLLGAPLAALGLVLHGAPYRLTGILVRRFPHTDEEEATDKIVAGLFLFPLFWTAEAILAARLLGVWGLVGLLVALIPTGFFSLTWHARRERAVREARAFLRYLRDGGVVERLQQTRRALAAELAAVARGAPEIWDTTDTDERRPA